MGTLVNNAFFLAGRRLWWIVAVLFGILIGMAIYLGPLQSLTRVVPLTEAIAYKNGFVRHEAVTLPAAWQDSTQNSHRVRHFSGTFTFVGDGPLSLLISRVAGQIQVQVNDVLVAQVVYEGSAMAGVGYRPVYVNLPTELLRPSNRLAVSLIADKFGRAGLAPVRIDRSEKIASAFYVFWFLSTGLLIVASTASSLAFCLSLVLWRGTRESAYRDSSVASGVLTLFFFGQLMIGDQGASWIYAGLLSMLPVAFVGFVLRSSFSVVGRLDSKIAWVCFIVPAALALSAMVGALANSRELLALVESGAYLLAFVLAAVLLNQHQQNQTPSLRFFAWAMFIAMLVSIADVVSRLGPSAGFAGLPYSEVAACIVLTTIFVFTIDQYIDASVAIRQWNVQLERRVQQTDAELREVYGKLLEREKHVAIATERHRILKEMHDGLGSQLVATMSLAENENAQRLEIQRSLDACMTELRLAVDSLDPAHSDLLSALGTLRQRLSPVLKRSGIAFDWSVRALERRKPMTPDEVLQVYRILQEAVTNIIKHSGATRAALSCGHCDRRGVVWLTLRDNGARIANNSDKGYGIQNMHSRAIGIGADFSIRLSSQTRRGTVIRMIWPVTGLVSDAG